MHIHMPILFYKVFARWNDMKNIAWKNRLYNFISISQAFLCCQNLKWICLLPWPQPNQLIISFLLPVSLTDCYTFFTQEVLSYWILLYLPEGTRFSSVKGIPFKKIILKVNCFKDKNVCIFFFFWSSTLWSSGPL